MNASLLQEILTRGARCFRHSRLLVVIRVAHSVRVFRGRQIHIYLVWQVVALLTVATFAGKLMLRPLARDVCLLVIFRPDLLV